MSENKTTTRNKHVDSKDMPLPLLQRLLLKPRTRIAARKERRLQSHATFLYPLLKTLLRRKTLTTGPTACLPAVAPEGITADSDHHEVQDVHQGVVVVAALAVPEVITV
jgi:hypothetical protein